ncbi:glycosyltransferase family 4 protein [Sinisalibacter aestuarii]|uniref:Glycosyltransferase family 1 protein n=1 Tax=Sinisalibacter aestuarii TaxID=2949426 RepID=A0ABQ5LUP8_9RHOB|nr:glycosyltransferase family 4 protein [Sinisalibacter aestuarii]GKY88150.1 hypothetical protein STA1M1_20190 [Sinisalibacter aestuarii]
MSRRIAIVETNAQGGLIHFAYQVADALAREGAEVSLITSPDYELADLPHNFTVLKMLRLWPIFDRKGGDRRQGTLQRYWRKVRRVWRGVLFYAAWTRVTLHLLRDKPDGVVLSMIHSPFQVVFFKAMKWAGIPMVQICHEIEQRDSQRGAWDRMVAHPLLAGCYDSFSTVVFLASSVESDYLARYGDATPTLMMLHGPQLIFPNDGVSAEALREKYGIAPGERVVLFFGLLRPSKGVSDLVEAFALLPDRAGLRLVIAGYPTKSFDTAALRAQIDRLGIAGQVSLFLDYVPNGDVAPLMEQGDLVVFPYRNATASGAASAAQSLGRPVVATNVGGFPEAIHDGETGYLAAPEDPAALADAIAKTLADPARARAMAEAGRQDMLENRSWGAFARGLIGVFDGLRPAPK